MKRKLIFILCLSLWVFDACLAQIEIEEKPVQEVYAPGAKPKAIKPKKIKVGLFLPFFKEGTDTNSLKHAFALSSLDYLAGVKVAIDSLEKTNSVSVDLYVEDTELDSSIVEGLLNRYQYRDLDVLIGPIFKSGVEMAIPIIQKRKTKMYLPFEKDFSSKRLNNVISSQKNSIAFANFFAFYFSKEYSTQGKKIVLIHSSKDGKAGKESREIDSLIKINLAGAIDTSGVMLLDIAAKENSNFANRLKKSKSYVFFINTKNNYYANNALGQIAKLIDSSPEVYCMEEILESEIPLFELWDSLHVKFLSRFFVNYEEERTGQLRKKIMESYNEDPAEFTYKGYNDIMFLLNAFSSGEDWLTESMNKEYVNEVSGFYFSQDPSSLGVFNGYHSVWRYDHLKLFRQY